MEEIYQIIVEYKNLHPLRFWTGITLTLVGLGLIVTFLRKRRKSDNQKSSAKKAILKTDSPKTSQTSTVKPENSNSSLDKAPKTIRKDYDSTLKDILPPKEVKEPTITYEPPIKEKPIQKPEIEVTRPKAKPKEVLPKAKAETEKSKNEILKVNYTSSISDQTDVYPIFRCPKKNTVVRSYRVGTTKRRGFKEEVFQRAIEDVFGNQFIVSGELRINTGKDTRPFEPDIALIDKSNDCLRIDIEIDEPYAGITRQPTHCKGDDTMRDIYFVDRGWIVIRFSEYQVHMFEKKCLRFISDVIKGVSSTYSIPASLAHSTSTENEKLWDIVQAQKWEKDKYRESYLNHEFKTIEERIETIERDFNEQEQKEEKLVNPTLIGVVDEKPSIGFNLINSHPRDKRIEFYPEPHIYTIDKTPAPSASTVISKFFPEFDSYGKASSLSPSNPLYGLPVEEIVQTWNSRGMEAANKGTFLHEQIEKYYLGEHYEKTEEFHLFEQFVSDHKNIKPHRSEWRIFDEEHHIAGTIDLISKNGVGFDIYDWKRSKKVVDTYNGEPITKDTWGNVGVGQLKDIDDTSYNRYCLQQSLYRYILEKNYNLTISKMYLVVLYPDNDRYYKVEVPYLKKRVEYILKTI